MMALFPYDTDLEWADIERNLSDIATMAEDIWARADIDMPPGSAEEIKLNEMDTIIMETAAALEIPPAAIYPNRHRIRWICYAELGEPIRHYVSLDGGPPKQINPQPT